MENQTVQNSFFGSNFTSRLGDQNAEGIQDFPIICLYFAAKSSPPCRIFTPVLLNFYREVNMIHKTFEIIYVPRDKDPDGFVSFLNQMPWLAIPIEEEQRIMEHKLRYNIQGIPSLVVLGQKGELITTEGRRHIIEKGEQAFEGWMQRYEELKMNSDEGQEHQQMLNEREVDEKHAN